MKKTKLKKWQKVELFWIDSLGESLWKNEKDMIGKDPEKFIEQSSCGYFLQETPRTIIIVQSRQIDAMTDGTHTVDHMMQIPKVAISKVVKL